MRLYIILITCLIMTSLKAQYTPDHNFIPQDHFSKISATVSISSPYNVDINQLQSTFQLKQEQYAVFQTNSIIGFKDYLNSFHEIGIHTSITQNLKLGAMGSWEHIKSEETYHSQWGVGLQLMAQINQWQTEFTVRHFTPWNKATLHMPLRTELIWTGQINLSSNFKFKGAVVANSYKIPDFHLNFEYLINKHWSAVPQISLWPITYALQINYKIKDQYKMGLGSKYNHTLGPSPYLRVHYHK